MVCNIAHNITDNVEIAPCVNSETFAHIIAEVDSVSTSAILHETISRGDRPIATIACNILSNVAPCVRALSIKADTA